MEQNKQELTKEEIIIKYIEDNPECTKDILMEKFNTSKAYSTMIIRKVKGKFNKEIFED